MFNIDEMKFVMDIFLEFLKTQHDYFKNLTTLNTGSIIIVIAFIERIFETPMQLSRYIILLAISLFVVSLLSSLNLMGKIHEIQEKLFFCASGTANSEDKIVDHMTSEINKLQIKVKRARCWGNGCFFGWGIHVSYFCICEFNFKLKMIYLQKVLI